MIAYMDMNHIITKIQEAINLLPATLMQLKQEGRKIIITQCDILPYEVFRAFGYSVIKMPRRVANAFIMGDSSLENDAVAFCTIADMIIVPKQCTIVPNEILSNRIFLIDCINGFAEDAAVAIHSMLSMILRAVGTTQEFPDDEELKKAVCLYEEIRKIMRTVSSFHAHKLTLIQLQLICDAAFSLLPDESLPLLQQLIVALESMDVPVPDNGEEKIKALLYGDGTNWEMFDECKKHDLTIVEDDACNVRRQFDISCNISSTNLYYELLMAYTFKAWCPAMRSAPERFELIYKALPNYDIGLVILLQSVLAIRNNHIDYLYEQCLLQGTNAIVCTEEEAIVQIQRYITGLKQRKHIAITIDLL